MKYLNRYSLRFGLGSFAVGSAYSTYSVNTNHQANPKMDWFHLSSWWCRCVTASRRRGQITGSTKQCLKLLDPWRLTARMTTYSRRHSESPLSFTWIPNHECLCLCFDLQGQQASPSIRVGLPVERFFPVYSGTCQRLSSSPLYMWD